MRTLSVEAANQLKNDGELLLVLQFARRIFNSWQILFALSGPHIMLTIAQAPDRFIPNFASRLDEVLPGLIHTPGDLFSTKDRHWIKMKRISDELYSYCQPQHHSGEA